LLSFNIWIKASFFYTIVLHPSLYLLFVSRRYGERFAVNTFSLGQPATGARRNYGRGSRRMPWPAPGWHWHLLYIDRLPSVYKPEKSNNCPQQRFWLRDIPMYHLHRYMGHRFFPLTLHFARPDAYVWNILVFVWAVACSIRRREQYMHKKNTHILL
jgi:hypothetical protein